MNTNRSALFDVIVVGGGTGGYAAALRAAELGLKTALLEKDKLGGVCLHRGCVPAKALLRTAEMADQVRRAGEMGIRVTGQTVDWPAANRAKKEAVDALYTGLTGLVRARRVELINGTASLSDGDRVELVENGSRRSLSYRHAVLATGSRPKIPPRMDIDGKTVITSNEALDLPELPRTVVIIGGGYIGVEFASMWAGLGVGVTLLEIAPGLLLQEDREIAALLTESLIGKGIDVRVDVEDIDVKRTGRGATVGVVSGGSREVIKADKVLAAVGRAPVTEAFVDAGIELADGYVKVDDHLRTTRANVLAVGDILATPQLAHVALAEGIFAAETIAGIEPKPIDYTAVPHCIYSNPEVAAVGLTEEQAVARGYEVKVARVSFEGNSRAKIAGETAGEAKVVGGQDGSVLGVHMLGSRVTEMISEAMLMVGWEASADDAAGFIHPHPTFSEALGEAILKLAGKPLHTL